VNSRSLLNLGLVVAVAALAALAIYQPGVKKPSPKRISALDADNIAHIEIDRPGQPKVVLAREGKQWRMTAPKPLYANAFKVQGLLGVARAEAHRSYPVSAVKLKNLGLDPAKAVLRLDGTAFAFGDVDPVDRSRYLRVGDTVYLVDDIAWYFLSGGWTGLVRPGLLPPGAKPSRIELPGLTLARDPKDGGWREEGAAKQPESDRLVALAQNWQQAQAITLRAYHAAKSLGTVRITTTADKVPLAFRITAYQPELVLARPELGIEYHLSANAKARLLALPSEKQASGHEDRPAAAGNTPPAEH